VWKLLCKRVGHGNCQKYSRQFFNHSQYFTFKIIGAENKVTQICLSVFTNIFLLFGVFRRAWVGYSVLWCTICCAQKSQKIVTIQDIVFFVLTLNPKAVFIVVVK